MDDSEEECEKTQVLHDSQEEEETPDISCAKQLEALWEKEGGKHQSSPGQSRPPGDPRDERCSNVIYSRPVAGRWVSYSRSSAVSSEGSVRPIIHEWSGPAHWLEHLVKRVGVSPLSSGESKLCSVDRAHRSEHLHNTESKCDRGSIPQ